jgi:polyhydroxyalkanoate synthase subunit PhaC
MADQQGADTKLPDPVELSQTMAKIAERSQRIVSDFLGRQNGEGVGMSDPLNIGRAFLEMTGRLMAAPSWR